MTGGVSHATPSQYQSATRRRPDGTVSISRHAIHCRSCHDRFSTSLCCRYRSLAASLLAALGVRRTNLHSSALGNYPPSVDESSLRGGVASPLANFSKTLNGSRYRREADGTLFSINSTSSHKISPKSVEKFLRQWRFSDVMASKGKFRRLLIIASESCTDLMKATFNAQCRICIPSASFAFFA